VLLVFVTLVGIGLGYWTHRAREQARIVKLIQDGGGSVCYERDGPDAPEPRNLVVEWLAGYLSRDHFERVVTASISGREVLRNLGQLRDLERVYIDGAVLADDDLKSLAHCRELQVLRISDFYGEGIPKSHLTDKSLKIIAKLPRLEVASLYGTGFTRKGIETLTTSPTLRDLQIVVFDESVVASDFDNMKRLGRIQSLRAWRGKSTESVVEVIVKW
jgi:hypothetical protein